MPQRPKDERPLQIEEDVAFQIRMNRVQRFCLWLFFFVLVASVAGLGGGGPLSSADARDPSGRLTLRFEKFARMTTSQTLEIEVRGDETASSFDLVLPGELLSDVQIESIYPQPDKQSSAQEGLLLKIDAEPPGFARVIILYRPLAPGWTGGVLRAGGSTVSFNQLVFP